MRVVTVVLDRTKILEKTFPEFKGSDEELKDHVRDFLEVEGILSTYITITEQ